MKSRTCLIYALSMGVVLLTGGCSSVSRLQQSLGSPLSEKSINSGNKGSETVLESELARFADDFAKSRDADISDAADAGKKASAAFASGRAMLDMECAGYLDAIGRRNQESAYLGKEINLANGLATAVMGVAGSAASAISIVGSSMSFTAASLDAYDTNFLFSDSSQAITDLVHGAQSAYLAKITPQLAPATLTHANMVTALTGYQEICRPAQIRALINKSLTNREVNANLPEGTQTSEGKNQAEGGGKNTSKDKNSADVEKKNELAAEVKKNPGFSSNSTRVKTIDSDVNVSSSPQILVLPTFTVK